MKLKELVFDNIKFVNKKIKNTAKEKRILTANLLNPQ